MKETNRKVQKIGNIALAIGIFAIFFEDLLPILSYVSMGGIIISYLTNLFNEYAVNKKVSPISILLCAGVVFWLVAGNVFKNPYAPVFGRAIIYAYLMYTSYQILKKVNKGFVAGAEALKPLAPLNLSIKVENPSLPSGVISQHTPEPPYPCTYTRGVR